MIDQQNFSNELLQWFHDQRGHITVPGRGSSDPYAIWIAEIMLQQTQVSTVSPYYQAWMDSYPTIAILALASLDQVLKSWEGLGYYSRARNLHRGAQYVMEMHGGSLPSSLKDLIKIPGIGPYTAAAITSIAFGQAVPLIDGNVLRVFTRLERNSDDITRIGTRKYISARLGQLVSKHDPAGFNQGLMDLGRVICTPRKPKCGSCPLVNICQAGLAGDPEHFPVRPKKETIPHYQVVIGLIQREEKILIQKRPVKGLLGGLWEFPGGKIEPGESGEDALLREIQEETGLKVTLGIKIGTIQHAYTHFKITLTAWFCHWEAGEAETRAASENRWITRSEIKKHAFPRANLKILDLLSE